MHVSEQGLAAMRRAMANAIELEILPDLNFLLPPILAIAKIATMVGLLGTVISMIGTFAEIEELSRQKGNSAHHVTEWFDRSGIVRHSPRAGDRHTPVFAHVLFKAWIANFEVKLKSARPKVIAPHPGGQELTAFGKKGVRPLEANRVFNALAGYRGGLTPFFPNALRWRMADKKRLLDVWILEINRVYREVPFAVVTDWLQQGRLLPDDKVRQAGGKTWHLIGGVPAFAPYLPLAEPLAVEDKADWCLTVSIWASCRCAARGRRRRHRHDSTHRHQPRAAHFFHDDRDRQLRGSADLKG